ncbi:hypothetical protein X801_03960 [Opisthorchis viverrini]|uniref:Uncharacterized protein n=1 Tax=Opisthorchis viverrini TaxID=6198 RepID=A0A1S8X0D5_OPIVI|nr:hypothetical protein X801_03960 [Opisthorchis viverrini]
MSTGIGRLLPLRQFCLFYCYRGVHKPSDISLISRSHRSIMNRFSILTNALTLKLQCCAIDDYQANLYSRSVWYHRQRIGLQQEGPTMDRKNQVTLRPIKVPASCCLRTANNLHYMNLTACQNGPLDPIHNQYINARANCFVLHQFD